MIKNTIENSIISFVRSQKVTKEKVTQFLTDCRVFIESENKSDEFFILYFYCNWALHPNIDRNPFLYTIVGEISKKFSGGGDYNIVPVLEITRLISESLAFISMILDQRKMQIQVSADFISELIWQIFSNLAHRKIQLPSERSKKAKLKIDKIIDLSGEEAEKLDTSKKFKRPGLDYSKPIIIKSIEVEKVDEGGVYFDIFLDDYTHLIRNTAPKNLTIKMGIKINIKADFKGGIKVSYSSADDR